MSTQDALTATLLVPAAVLGLVGWQAARAGRTQLGLSPRGGAVGELARGGLFSVPFAAVLVVVFPLVGLSDTSAGGGSAGEVVGIWVYFLMLFLLEEVVFRGLLMTGLGVVAGRSVALGLTAVLVALPYAFNPDSSVLALVGAVVTNLLHGVVRWRTGRIWWGLGQRWVWNSLVVSVGFADSAFSLNAPALSQRLTGPDWLTGGAFGVEGGVVGIAFLVAMITGAVPVARGRRGPWEVAAPSEVGGQTGSP